MTKFMPDTFTEKEILARTIYGEARGELQYGNDSLWSIGHVIINRYKATTWFGKSVKDVCLKPFQFSCWNENDPNYALLTQRRILDGIYQYCLEIADDLLSFKSKRQDKTYGSNHYHHRLIMPHWAKNYTPLYEIGNHRFYRL